LVLPLLSRKLHGEVVRPAASLTMPQNASAARAGAHFAWVDVCSRCRFPFTVGSHVYTLIVDVVPPLLKSLITSRSPALWTPLNLKPPPLLTSVCSILFWKNQKPCWASPLLSKRSEPKYRTSHVVSPTGASQAVPPPAGSTGSEYLAAKL
jgi:hypothetical protein